jgi:hypothetical protein
MSTMELRRKAKKEIDRLSGQRLRFVSHLLAYVNDPQTDEATKELLEIPGFLESFGRGVKDIRAGRVTHWRKVRRRA